MDHMYTKEEVYSATMAYFNGDDLAAKVWIDKYALRNKSGEILELTPDDMHHRMAKEFARIEKSKFKQPLDEQTIYESMKDFAFIVPQGSPMYGIGNPYSVTSLSNCYFLTAPLDGYNSILDVDKELVNISKRRGGCGIDLSNLRPSGSPTNNAARSSTGIVSWMNRYSNSVREVGQCLAHDSLVLTKNGLKEIQHVVPKVDDVWTKKGWIKVVDLVFNGRKQLYEVVTKAGYRIKSTLDHKFAVEYDGTVTEKTLNDISVDDKIILIPGTAYNNLDQPILSEEFAYLLGYICGDGFVFYDMSGRVTSVTLRGTDCPFIKQKLTDLVKTELGADIVYDDLNRPYIDDVNVLRNLPANGLFVPSLPQRILQASSNVQMAFLSGYFDADGDISDSKNEYIFTSMGKDFIQKVQLILMANGIPSKLSCEDRSGVCWPDLYSLCVVGEYAQQKMLQLLQHSYKIQTKQFVAKRDCWATPYTANKNGIDHEKYLDVSYGGHISAQVYNRLQCDEKLDLYNLLLTDTVVSIDKSTVDDTYDLELEDEHLFWCDGFYVHNSHRRGALILTLSIHHPDILNFITAKHDDVSITGANVSVKLTQEFINAVQNDTEYELRFPVDDHSTPLISQMISAKKVWDVLIHSSWLRAEPGVLMWDNVLKGPADCYKTYRAVGNNPSLRKGTLILTKKGPRAIETLQDKSFLVYNLQHKYSPAFCRLSGKNVPLYAIKLNTGISYYATKEHKWATFDGQKTTLELQADDKLPILKKNKVFRGNLGDEDDGFLIGWWLGYWWSTLRTDCHKNQYSLICSKKDNDSGISDKLIAILRAKIQFDEHFSEHTRNGSTWYELNTINHKLDQYMKQFGSPNKVDGLSKELICNMSEDFAKGLINGYLSLGGSVDEVSRCIRFVSKDKKLLLDISEILGFYGIKATLKYSRRHNVTFPNGNNHERIYGVYYLVIDDLDSEQHFARLFSSSVDYKNLELENILFRQKKIDSPPIDFVKVVSVTKTDLTEDVWDITVDDEHNCFSLSHCVTHNCSELPLEESGSCRLLCLNLFSFVDKPFTKSAKFDFDKFFQYAKLAQRLMDDMVDLESEKIDNILAKIESDPEPDNVKLPERQMWQKIKQHGDEGRRTGTGITALGDVFAALNIAYGSQKSIDLAEKIYRTLKLGCYTSSVEMAKELGPFKEWNSDLEKDCEFLLRIKEEDPLLYSQMNKYGRRNVALLTTAPTGSVSLLTQTTSGIEPLFEIQHTRRRKVTDGDTAFDFVDKTGDKWKNYSVLHPKVKLWTEITKENDITKSPWYKSCAGDLDPMQRVELQAVIQKNTCHGLSVTINLPNDTKEEIISQIYMKAHKLGCKGITVYRDGCRTGVLVKDEHNKRPKEIQANVHHLSVNGNPFFVLVGLLNNKPYEIFAGKNNVIDSQAKTCIITKMKRPKQYKATFDDSTELCPITAFCSDEQEMATRLVSLLLQSDTPIEKVINQLDKTQGNLTNFSKALSRILKKYIKDGEIGEQCPECGDKLIKRSGCTECAGNCGYSKCS